MNDLIQIYDDARLNKRLVRDKVLVARANILSKYLSKQLGSIDGSYYNQCCFEVSCQPVCPGAPVTVLRGTIPAVLGQLGKRAIKYLGTVDGKTPFERRDESYTDMKSYVPMGCGGKDPYYNLTGAKVDVFDPPTDNTTNLMIRAVFADPFACGCPEDDIFVPADHIDEIEQQIKIDLSTFLMQRRIDKMNNANSDT
jgi:hypothetical protein